LLHGVPQHVSNVLGHSNPSPRQPHCSVPVSPWGKRMPACMQDRSRSGISGPTAAYGAETCRGAPSAVRGRGQVPVRSSAPTYASRGLVAPDPSSAAALDPEESATVPGFCEGRSVGSPGVSEASVSPDPRRRRRTTATTPAVVAPTPAAPHAHGLDAAARGSGSLDSLGRDLRSATRLIGRFHHGGGGVSFPRRAKASALSSFIRRLSLPLVTSAGLAPTDPSDRAVGPLHAGSDRLLEPSLVLLPSDSPSRPFPRRALPRIRPPCLIRTAPA
jgi:hypothetical protein